METLRGSINSCLLVPGAGNGGEVQGSESTMGFCKVDPERGHRLHVTDRVFAREVRGQFGCV